VEFSNKEELMKKIWGVVELASSFASTLPLRRFSEIEFSKEIGISTVKLI